MEKWKRTLGGIALVALIAVQPGCRQKESTTQNSSPASAASPWSPGAPDPLRVALLPVEGNSALDQKIAAAQKQVHAPGNTNAAIETLGWLFVAKARAAFDPGFYKLAESCAQSLDARQPGSLEAMLLRAHVLQNLHRFKEAEPLSRSLTTQRGLAFDFAVLGDVLMEQGRLDEAIDAYQKMADLKPDLQAFTRIAHVRWLKGDLDGAIEMMHMAAQATSPQDSETAAWVHSRLAVYWMQRGDFAQCQRYCQAALEFQPDYPPALLALGRLDLAQNKTDEALAHLHRAVKANPLPEYLWTLSEALRAANKGAEAADVEQRLKASGANADPRTFALYLATRGEDAATAMRLADSEFKTRADVFTWDALAWSLAAQGHWPEAAEKIQHALAEGTQDARLHLHAGIIAAKNGDATARDLHLNQARAISQMLLPSERALLAKEQANFAEAKPVADSVAVGATAR